MARQPNLLFLMPDQLRWDFLSCYGADFIKTPNIDRIANEGVRYSRAYSTSPICVPARAALLTGLNAIRNGVTDNGQWLRPDLAACGIHTWPELLNQQGYYTAAIGKMHFYPWDINHGFQYRSICEDKRWLHVRDDYYHFLHERGHRKYHGNEHDGYFENRGAIVSKLPWELAWDHFVGQEACRFLRAYGKVEDNAASADTPFAMMVGFPGPHCPYDPNQEFLDGIDPAAMPPAVPNAGHTPKLHQSNIEGNKRPWNGVDYSEFTEEQKRKVRAHYAALVKQIDYEVGQILDTLAEIGQLDNTIIIFGSDHGDYLGDHDLIGKGTFYEASIHVPLLVRFPDGSQRGLYDGLVTLGDVTATLLALAGCSLPAYLDSRPLPGLGLTTTPREQIFGMVSNGWMVQDARWRLAKYSTGEAVLFDLQHDPHEQQNLLNSAEHQTIRQQLDMALTQEIMRSLTLAHEEKRVYRSDLSQDLLYGREGWQRPYPQPIGAAP
jgi:arylsulfatase A-like enzyme